MLPDEIPFPVVVLMMYSKMASADMIFVALYLHIMIDVAMESYAHVLEMYSNEKTRQDFLEMYELINI